jgi:gamma-glutamyltranspeptidase / glutathione hydrolase
MWPSSAHAYLPGGRIPAVGEIYVQRDLAGIFSRLMDAEYRGRRRGRREALEAAHDAFYKGEIAERIVKFVQKSRFPDSTGKLHSGLITKEDLQRYATRVEEPVTANYRGYDVFKCGPWSQGPVFLHQLNILEGYDLAAMGHNSPEYIHLLIEVAKLAFSDRETYYGDPDFAEVPSMSFYPRNTPRCAVNSIDPDNASMELRPGNARAYRPREQQGGSDIHKGDITHLDAVDQWGACCPRRPPAAGSAARRSSKGWASPSEPARRCFHWIPATPIASGRESVPARPSPLPWG